MCLKIKLLFRFSFIPILIHLFKIHFAKRFPQAIGLLFDVLKSFDKFFIGSFQRILWIETEMPSVIDQ